MIIKLTELKKVDDTHKRVEAPLWVNMTHVQYFSKSTKGHDTHLSIQGKSYLFVKETPEEIMELMMVPKLICGDVDLSKVDMRPGGNVIFGAR